MAANKPEPAGTVKEFRDAMKSHIVDGDLFISYKDLVAMTTRWGEVPCAYMLSSLAGSGVLTYPYKSKFLPPPEEYMKRLATASYVDMHEDRLPRSKHVPWGFGPAGGARRPLAFVVGDAAYGEVDQITDHFTEKARVSARIHNKDPPIKAWATPVLSLRAFRSAIQMALRDRAALDTYVLREGSYRALPECTLFKVSLATAIYRFFGAKLVLDPFAGWGDRALGAAGAGVQRYVGVDPNPALAPGHKKILDFLGGCGGTDCAFRSAPFEAYTQEMCDADFSSPPGLVFSSPPFASYEIYSEDDPHQSSRFSTTEAWLSEWFLPVTDRAWEFLAPGGHLAYYLADKDGEVTGPLCRHMDGAGRTFLGVIACRRGGKRPLPLWVWQKAAPAPTS